MAVTGSASAQQAGEPTQVDASRGGVTFSSGVNSLTIGARAQLRWTLDDREQADRDLEGAGLGNADPASTQFDVPRMRVTLSGGAYRPWLRYQFQFDFSRTSGEGASKIKDMILEFRPTGQPYRFQVGQFKAPFGLQQLVSSGRLQFVDRSITDAKFAPGRDMGAMLAGRLAADRVGYEIGAFNGSGESIRQTTAAPFWAARVYVQPAGTVALSESAVDAGDGLVWHAGLAVRSGRQVRGRTDPEVFENADTQTAFDVELALRTPLVFATSEVFWMNDEQENPIVGPDITSRGFHVQGGYMVVPGATEVGLRYARVAGNTDVDDALVTELLGVVGHYFRAHSLKLQADAGRISYGPNFAQLSSRARSGLPSLGTRLVSGESLSDLQVRVQLQLTF